MYTLITFAKTILYFTFSHVTKEEVLKEIVNLDTTTSSKDTDIPTKIIKPNSVFLHLFYVKLLTICLIHQHLQHHLS